MICKFLLFLLNVDARNFCKVYLAKIPTAYKRKCFASSWGNHHRQVEEISLCGARNSIGGKLRDTLREKNYSLLITTLPIVFLLALFLSYPKITQYLLALPKPWRLALSPILFIPISLTIGFPFPMGIRYLASVKYERSYTWTVNGIASVLTTIVSEYIAFSIGIDKLIFMGFLLYTGILIIWLFTYKHPFTNKPTVLSWPSIMWIYYPLSCDSK